MRRRYMDAMALVQRFGKPDIFLTMTCNPKWDEIKHELYPGQTPQDHPDLIVWVFKAKLEELTDRLMKKDIVARSEPRQTLLIELVLEYVSAVAQVDSRTQEL